METEGCNDDFVYQYEAIGQNKIRVLVLLAGERDDDLWGYFETSNSDERPVYKALSYAWGARVFSQTLYLVGGAIAITPVVHAALRRLRDEDVPVRLWIDAICIDQGNLAEKNHQVTRMAQVYEEAQEVLIWLADETDDDDHNRSMIERLNGWYRLWFDWRASSVSSAESTVLKESWRTCGPDSGSFGRSSALLHRLWASPWFTRLWVVQEAAAGAHLTFLYGKCSSGFTSLRRALELSIHLVEDIAKNGRVEIPVDLQCARRAYSTLTHISRLRNPLPSPELRESVEHLTRPSDPVLIRSRLTSAVTNQVGGLLLQNLIWCSDLSVTDPHDLAYAVRSLSGIEDVESLTPDYALSLAELWTRVSRHILSQESEPSIVLSLAKAMPGNGMDGLPSWAINLAHLGEQSRKRYRDGCRATIEYSAEGPGGGESVLASMDSTRFTLDPDDASLLSSPAIQIFRIGQPLAPDEFGTSALFQDFATCEFGTLTYWLFDRSIMIFRSSSRQSEFLQTSPAKVDSASSTRSRKRIPPESGHMGRLPPATQVGDAVYILQGCPLPFVLRPLPNSRHSLVGEVYCADFASSQAARQLRFPWPSDGKDVVTVTLQ